MDDQENPPAPTADPTPTQADSSSPEADPPARTVDSPAPVADSPAGVVDSPDRGADSPTASGDSPNCIAGSPHPAGDSPAATGDPLPATSASLRNVDSSSGAVDSPGGNADSPDRGVDSPAGQGDSHTAFTGIPTTNVPANPTFAAQPFVGPPGVPWGFLAFFTGFGGFYLVSLVVTGAAAAVAINPDAVQSNLRGPIVLLALLPNLLLGVAPAVLSWWRGHGPRVDFGIRFTKNDLSTGFVCGIAALGIGLVVNLLLQALVFHDRNQQSAAEELSQLSGGRSVWLLVALLFVVIGAPLTEELLLRGALWGALEHYRVPRLVILPLTALVFAFLHQEPTLTLALFGQGLALGVARMRTGGIGASMIAHATNNALPAVVLWFISK
jgi:membrane protease YdiL (CAAX protease family)